MSARLVAIFSFALCVFSATNASADGAVYVGTGVANLNSLESAGRFGLGAEVGLRWGFSDYWAVFGDVSSSYHFEEVTEEYELPSTLVTQLALGIRYNLDVFTYVPWVGLAATGYLRAPQSEFFENEFNAGTKVSLGVDWRLARNWSLGGYAELHTIWSALDQFPLYTQLGINGTYHFRF